ncbi:MAG: ABC transporter ATP-binding protein [Theionarchaea archaeon]|nr:ABC transporter ATP-binding protein [Theionarchaea archaeon]MBU7001448.1 ABC transporter ATP-binding protein [Theionarchaea archaeon]MBU7022452.1 ABC transporter ATP-binding protein [Theionarchaea archaeon]MBU7036099.1 ABC transporter ATP-binding protein [Theionarchaea archaeon]
MPIIEAVNLSKYYEPPREGIFGWRQILKEIRGPQQTLLALKNVNLSVKKGELFGLLGPNGAGKTTFCKIMNALVIPTEGQILIDGKDSIKEHRQIAAQMVTVFSGDIDTWNIFTRRLTVEKNFEFMAKLWHVPDDKIKERIDYTIDIMKLHDKRLDWYQKLSAGLKQRVYLGLTLIVQPTIAVLDEPTIHLDVPSKRIIHDVIRDELCKNLGTTVLLATHNMEEAEKLCDRVAILNRGEIKVVDNPQNVRGFSAVLDMLEVKLMGVNESLLQALDAIPCIKTAQLIQGPVPTLRLHFSDKEKYISQIIDCLVKNATIVDLRLKEPTFEDIFVSVLENDTSGGGDTCEPS